MTGQPGGKGRSGAARGPEKKFAKRGFAGKGEGERRPYAGKPDGERSYDKKPYSGAGKPYAGKREGASAAAAAITTHAPRRSPRARRSSRTRKDFRPRDDRGGESVRTRRAAISRDVPRRPRVLQTGNSATRSPTRPREGGGEKRPYTPRGEGFRKDGDRPRGDRPYSARPPRDGDRPRGDRPERKFGGDKKFSRGAPDRGPRKDFGSRPDRGKDFGADRGDSKPWQKRDASSPDHVGRNSRPSRDGARNFDKPRFDKPREDRGGEERPRFSRPREDRPQGDRPFRERPKFDRPARGPSEIRSPPARGPQRLAGASAQRGA